MKKALISKIQSYSTKDGPGLRTTVFFMGCNLKCLWCANPENMEHRQRVFYFKERCHQCGECVKHANHHSISFDKTGCHINRELCDNIMDMIDICPFDAYEKIGDEIDSDTLVKKLLREKDFFELGNGGVTFSGGEAALQDQFIIEVADKLKENNIHICLDTAGLIESNKFRKLIKHVDMILYDIKAIDNDIHKKCTNVSNELILKNAKIISEENIPMIVRLVIVPSYNDIREDIKKRIDFICELGECVQQVDILKYHIYGIGKYEKLGKTYPIEKSLTVDDQLIKELEIYAKDKGLKVTIGG